MKKYQIIINNIRFQIIAGKINKIPELYTIFARKNARLHNKTTKSRPGRGQIFGLEDLTSLLVAAAVISQHRLHISHLEPSQHPHTGSRCLHLLHLQVSADVDVGWVHPWVGLGQTRSI